MGFNHAQRGFGKGHVGSSAPVSAVWCRGHFATIFEVSFHFLLPCFLMVPCLFEGKGTERARQEQNETERGERCRALSGGNFYRGKCA